MKNYLKINLWPKYQNNDELLSKIEKFKKDKNLIDVHPEFSLGFEISFWGGSKNDIRFTSKIFAFDNEENIYVVWDCYWFPIKNDEIRQIEIIN